MATLSLSEVQNDYGTYRGNSLVGELGSIGTVPNAGLEGINGVSAPFNPNTTDRTLIPSAVGTIGSASPSQYFVDVDLEGGSYAGMQFDVGPARGGTVPISEPPGDLIDATPTEPIEVEVFDTSTNEINIIKPDTSDIDLIDIRDSNPFTGGGGGTYVGGGSGGGFRDVRFDEFPYTNDFFNNQDEFTLREAQQGRVF
jgi:hypothetical protein